MLHVVKCYVHPSEAHILGRLWRTATRWAQNTLPGLGGLDGATRRD